MPGKTAAASSPTSCSSRKPRCFRTPTAGRPARKSRARLGRWTFDLAGKPTVTQTYLDDLTGEFPRFDERRAGLPPPPLVRLRHPNSRCSGALSASSPVDGKRHTPRQLSPCRRATPSPSRSSLPRRRCRRGRWLAARGGLARCREPQRSCGLQRHRRRSGSRCAGAAWAPGARRLSRQLGRRGVTPASGGENLRVTKSPSAEISLLVIIPGRAVWRGPGMTIDRLSFFWLSHCN